MNRIFNFFSNPLTILVVGGLLLSIASFTGLTIGVDESNWNITGRMWAEDGLLPYRDTITNKTPGIFIVMYISQTLFGNTFIFPRAVGILATILTGLLIYLLTKRIWNVRAAILATWIFMLIMPLDVVDGAYVQTESFMNLFRIAAFASMFWGVRTPRRFYWILASGFFFGLAISFKQIAILDLIPLLFSIWWLGERTLKWVSMAFGTFILGTIGSVFLSITPFILSGGTLLQYWHGAWTILFESGIIKQTILGRISGFVKNYFEDDLFLFIMGTVGFLFLFFRKKLSDFKYAAPIALWIVTDFIAYNAQGQYFDHHHKVFLLSAAIVFGIMADLLLSKVNVPHITTVTIVGLVFLYTFFQPDYFHFIRNRIINQISDPNRLIAEHITTVTKPSDSIYISGNAGGPIYYFAHRQPASRQYISDLLNAPGSLEELKNDLITKKPELIVIPHSPKMPIWLYDIIRDRYNLTLDKYGFNIYALDI